MDLAASRPDVVEVPLGLIDDPELPSRSTMDEQKLDELATSIRRIGLIQPIGLVRNGDRFTVVYGHRRTIASNRAGLVAVRALVYADKTAGIDAAQFAENRFREDLNPADEAVWFSDLLERKCDGDVDRLCELLNEKRTYVENRLLLFQGDQNVFESLQAGDITIGVAHQLNKCTEDAHRRMLLHHAVSGGATVAVVSGWIQDWKKQQNYAAGGPAPSGDPIQPGPVPETNYFRCAVCGGTDRVHMMQPINVHTDCKSAILDKLLASYRGEN